MRLMNVGGSLVVDNANMNYELLCEYVARSSLPSDRQNLADFVNERKWRLCGSVERFIEEESNDPVDVKNFLWRMYKFLQERPDYPNYQSYYENAN